jgi:DNA-binding transcriptional LysR family regulator
MARDGSLAPSSLDEIATFLVVVEEESFVEAARRLGVRTSSVSRAIQRLEDRLGARLLERTTRRVAITPAGKALRDRAGQHVEALRCTIERFADREGPLRGVLRVSAAGDLGAAVLAEVVPRFAERHPALRIEVLLTTRVVDLVAENVDVALRAGASRDAAVTCTRVGELELGLFASPAYLARRGAPQKMRDLAGHELLAFLFEPRRGTWPLVVRGERHDLPVEPVIAANDAATLVGLALAGAGIALLPRHAVREHEAAERVVRVLPDVHGSAPPIHVVCSSSRHTPRKVVAFRDAIVEHLRKHAL